MSAAQTFTLANTGTGPLNVSTVSLNGTDAGQYQLSNDTCSGQAVAQGGHCSFDVRFAPSAPGAHDQAMLRIVSDDPGSPTDLTLHGIAITPLIAIGPRIAVNPGAR